MAVTSPPLSHCLLGGRQNFSEPLALAPTCANISLATQAQLIESATATECVSLLTFAAHCAFAYTVFVIVDVCIRLGMRRWSTLARSASAVHDAEVRQCLVSSVHALYSVGATFYLALCIERPFGVDASLRHIPHGHITPVGCVFFAYLLWDLSHILFHCAIYAKCVAETAVHHVGFLLMMLINQRVLWFNYAFPVLYIGELSTFFLNTRLLYRKFEVPELWASACFALSFALTRIFLMGGLVLHLLASYQAALTLLGPALRVSYLGGIPAMYCLNLFWFSKIVANVRKTLRSTKQL